MFGSALGDPSGFAPEIKLPEIVSQEGNRFLNLRNKFTLVLNL